eukprot:8347278-Lingulodinium_polyedra.AAC.1
MVEGMRGDERLASLMLTSGGWEAAKKAAVEMQDRMSKFGKELFGRANSLKRRKGDVDTVISVFAGLTEKSST